MSEALPPVTAGIARPLGSASGALGVLSPATLFEAVERERADLRLIMREPSSGGLVIVVFRAGSPTMVFSPGDGRSVGELLLAAGLIDRATLAALVQERPQGAASLEQLVQSRTQLSGRTLQRYFDYQARLRLLDALVWRDGFFRLEEYSAGQEASFRLDLPNVHALLARARARAEALPGLLAQLPTSPANTLVRRRRFGTRPSSALESVIYETLDEPLLIPQLVARLLVDDDLVLAAVLHLVEEKALVLQPRVALASPVPSQPKDDPLHAVAVRRILEKLRGRPVGDSAETLWVIVLSARPEVGASLVSRLGSAPGVVMVGDESDSSTGLAGRSLSLGTGCRLSLLALRPEALSRVALEGILARCDALALVRSTAAPEEMSRLAQLHSLIENQRGEPHPLVLGVDLDAGQRQWDDFPDATLGISSWETRSPEWLVDRILDGLLAAASGRLSHTS